MSLAPRALSIQSVMSALPQSQCRRCGFAGCWPYARAIVRGQAPLDRCTPGGAKTRAALAVLCAAEHPPPPETDTVDVLEPVTIRAQECIGCGRCLPACPVDAIAGAVGYLHVVLPNACTGCQLCLPSCPVDCLSVTPGTPLAPAPLARHRYNHKRRRQAKTTRHESRRAAAARKRQEIAEAVSRTRQRRGWQQSTPDLKMAPLIEQGDLMSGHYPFGGNANRVSVFAFFEKNQLSLDLQKQYYTWWYDFAKNFVSHDADLKVTRSVDFARFPYGQHAETNFHLHDYRWATAMADLGAFIADIIFPKMNEKALHKVEHDYEAMLKKLLAEREKAPRPAPPEVGRYRHV